MLLVDDFNTKEIKWEEVEVKENVGSWSKELLHTMIVNTVRHWVNQLTRCRGEEELSQLD